MAESRNMFSRRICPICGKEFMPAACHIYKVKGKFVCSWSCVIRNEKENEKEKVTKNDYIS